MPIPKRSSRKIESKKSESKYEWFSNNSNFENHNNSSNSWKESPWCLKTWWIILWVFILISIISGIFNWSWNNKSNNSYKALHSRTPIRFGDMETGNLTHLGAELVVQMLMLYSTSPHARRLTQSMLTDDAFNINVKLDMDSTNRNAEILNVYLKTMGLKLVFRKKPKEFIQPMLINPMSFNFDPSLSQMDRLIKPMTFYSKDEKIDLERNVLRLIEQNHGLIDPIEIYPMTFYGKTKKEEDANE